MYAYPALCNMSTYLQKKLERVEKRVFRIIVIDNAFPTLFSVGDTMCCNIVSQVASNSDHPLREFFKENSYNSVRKFLPARKPMTKTKQFGTSLVTYCK